MRVLATLVVFGTMAAAASGATHVVRWSPFVGDALRPGLVATPAFGGDCFTGSFAVHNAYRCLDGHFLRDPCFADPARDDAVLCVRDPFSRGVVRLRVSGNLDGSGSAPPSLVWAVRLANGQRCTFFAGEPRAPTPPGGARTTAARGAGPSSGASRSAAAPRGGSGFRTPSHPAASGWSPSAPPRPVGADDQKSPQPVLKAS